MRNYRRELTFLELVTPSRRRPWMPAFIILTCFFLAAGGVGTFLYLKHKGAVVTSDTTFVGVSTPTPTATPTPEPTVEVRRAEPITTPTPNATVQPTPTNHRPRHHRRVSGD